ncbi:MAG: hypothetical protein R2792_04805 [Saprospiraceae bacterium]
MHQDQAFMKKNYLINPVLLLLGIALVFILTINSSNAIASGWQANYFIPLIYIYDKFVYGFIVGLTLILARYINLGISNVEKRGLRYALLLVVNLVLIAIFFWVSGSFLDDTVRQVNRKMEMKHQ